MNKSFFVMIIAFLALCNIAFSGILADVQGSSEVLTGGKWVPAKVGMDIPDGTKLMTGVGGSMKITAKVGYFIVKEMSMVTYSEQTSGKTVDQKVNIEVGKVRVRYDKQAGVVSSFKVQTPKGTASVRGTEEDVEYFPTSGMALDVIEGSVDMIDNSGSSFVATEGEQAGVSSGGIYSESDVMEENAGYSDQYSDNDTSNGFIDNATGDIFNPEESGTGLENSVDLELL